MRRERKTTGVAPLTPREQQVFIRLAQGLPNQEIADELGISVKTVDTHRGHVLDKLDLRHNGDLTWFALRCGYLTLEERDVVPDRGLARADDPPFVPAAGP